MADVSQSTRTAGRPAAAVPPTGRASLSARQLSAWRTFLRAHASVTRRLEQDLIAEHQLPLASYDVLVQLSEAPGRRLRMTDLADRVLLSRSGLTRLVDRLAGEGLVAREACPSDARGTFTVLTEAGLDRLRRAAPTHLRGIEEYVTRRLDGDELDKLGALLCRLLPDGAGGDAAEQPATTCGADAEDGQRAAAD
jgi:DNA-binding MarR family transcriptional regulator